MQFFVNCWKTCKWFYTWIWPVNQFFCELLIAWIFGLQCNFSWIAEKPAFGFICEFGLLCNFFMNCCEPEFGLSCNFLWIAVKPAFGFICEFGPLCNFSWIAEKPAFGFLCEFGLLRNFSWIAEKIILFLCVNSWKTCFWFYLWIWLVVQFFINC